MRSRSAEECPRPERVYLAGPRKEDEEGYFVDQAANIKGAVKVPIFGLGGIRNFSVMEKIVREGRADLISTSRPFIREPFLVRKLRREKSKNPNASLASVL